MNIKRIIYPLAVLFILNSSAFAQSSTDSIKDFDGNYYHLVKINNQVWFKENLKVTHYRNGDEIPNVIDETKWGKLTTGAYCDYDNNKSNSDVYGRLYNWFAVNDERKICPEGWHVSTRDDWSALIEFMEGDSIAGGKIKETGTAHWNSPNAVSSKRNNFTALPGGARNQGGGFTGIKDYGDWWSSTEYNSGYAWYYYLSSVGMGFYSKSSNKENAFSIRCIKD